MREGLQEQLLMVFMVRHSLLINYGRVAKEWPTAME